MKVSNEKGGIMAYLKGLRLVWWSKSMDDLLFVSIFPFAGLPLPFILLFCVVQSLRFTYLYVRKRDVHSWYWEMIDRAGIYRCHLCNRVFGKGGECRSESKI